MEIFEINPDHMVWAKCPEPMCKTVVHACCADHAEASMQDHLNTALKIHYLLTHTT